VDDIGDGHVGRCSMTFQESSYKALNPLTPKPALTFNVEIATAQDFELKKKIHNSPLLIYGMEITI